MTSQASRQLYLLSGPVVHRETKCPLCPEHKHQGSVPVTYKLWLNRALIHFQFHCCYLRDLWKGFTRVVHSSMESLALSLMNHLEGAWLALKNLSNKAEIVAKVSKYEKQKLPQSLAWCRKDAKGLMELITFVKILYFLKIETYENKLVSSYLSDSLSAVRWGTTTFVTAWSLF